MQMNFWLVNLFQRLVNSNSRSDRRVKSSHFKVIPAQIESLERRVVLSPHAITVDIGGDADVANHTTLRNAIALANAEPGGGDTINFDPSVAGVITLTQGELDISNAVTIAGPGSGTLTISGNNASRIFVVGDSNPTKYDVTIYSLTLSQGNSTAEAIQVGLGGAIYNDENLTLHDDVISNNTAKDGGGVFNNLIVTSNNDTFSGNSVSVYGGGIYNANTLISTADLFSSNTAANGGGIENLGTQTSTNDTFLGNSTTVQGGAVDNEGTLTSFGDTFSGNSSTQVGGGGAGGAIYNVDALISTNDTFFNNTAMTGGGIFSFNAAMTTANDTIVGNIGRGIELHQGTWNSVNTIVAGNVLSSMSNTASDVINSSGTVNALYTLIGDAGSAGGITNGTRHNLVGKPVASVFVTDGSGNPVLANNGGLVQTIALLAKGPAVGVGGPLATSTASVAQSSSPTTITVNSSTFIAVGDKLRIDNEVVLVSTVIDATHISVERGQLNTIVAAHLANAPILLVNDATNVIRINNDLGAVAEINHAPAGTSKTVSTFENISYTVKATDFGFTDTNDSPANLLLGIQIDTISTSGILTDNGLAVTAGQFVSATDVQAGKLMFTPTAFLIGGPFAICTFQVEDNGGTANGGVNLDSETAELDLNIVHINQAPTGTSSTLSTLENSAYVFKTSDFGFSDPNDSPSNALMAVKFTTLPTAGTLADNGTALSAGQIVSVSDITSGHLIFTPNAYLSGNAFFLAKFQVQDDGGTVNGGHNLDPNPKLLDINIVHVNQSPVGTPGTVTTLQNHPYALKIADFGLTDPHDVPPNSLLAVKFATVPTAGTLADNGVAVTAGQFVSATDIKNGKLTFTSTAGLSGGPYFLCRFQVEDTGGTANGGKDLDPSAKVLKINILHVNHAPAGTSKTATMLENGSYAVKAADFGFADSQDSPANSLQAVKVTTLPTQGTLRDNGTAVTVGQFVSVTDINGGKLVFTPNRYLTGGPFPLCQFQVQDNGGTANGGVNLDPTAKTLSVTITSVNQAPVGTSGTVTAVHNTAYVMKTSDFGFTDPNDNPPNTLLAVKFTTLPTAGTLTDNGTAVTANQLVSAADISSGKLIFTPLSNLHSGTYFQCKFQVQDNGGTANGGANLDTTARILDIAITP